jgi:hypothetical protein
MVDSIGVNRARIRAHIVHSLFIHHNRNARESAAIGFKVGRVLVVSPSELAGRLVEHVIEDAHRSTIPVADPRRLVDVKH